MTGKIISFISGKGGTGKTLISATVGEILAENNYKVLLIDWDFGTRGLTSYLLPLEEIPTKGILDIIFDEINFDNLQPFKINSNLDILPSLSIIRNSLEYSDIVRLNQMIGPQGINKLKNILYNILENFRHEYDYILIDTRSGIEILSIFPVFFSDWYIIICEEDRTSWRLSSTLQNAIKKYMIDIAITNKITIPILLGFILNETTTVFTEKMINFLELDVFNRNKCLAVIPFEENVRKTFSEDKSVAMYCKKSDFYKNLLNIAYEYFKADKIIKKKDASKDLPAYFTIRKTTSTRVLLPIVTTIITLITIFIFTTYYSKYLINQSTIFIILIITFMLSIINTILHYFNKLI